MDSIPISPARLTINRVWQAVEGGRVIGSGEASRRRDGRAFLSIDTWDTEVFDQLAATIPADLAGPLHTIVDENDTDLIARWERAGFTVVRREREYVLDPAVAAVVPPTGVTLLGVGAARQPALREAYEAIHAEVDAEVGWDTMPVEMPPHPDGPAADTSRYAVAVHAGTYVGLLRVVGRRRHARIGLIAVLSGERRRGVARALLTTVLASLHRDGIETVSAEIDDRNTAAIALFSALGARPAGGTVLLRRDA